ncbi:MAG: hypothetical protein JRI25_16935 [Deltaproteobacteria bacterium]|nr:hypothetical protein [Deltaproteobacteria bacterium]
MHTHDRSAMPIAFGPMTSSPWPGDLGLSRRALYYKLERLGLHTRNIT